MAEIKYISQANMIKILGKIKATYVQQVAGKGLSTNDLTNELVEKINTASAGNHAHKNLALLETYTQTEADLQSAVEQKHTHANAEELALIASGDKAKWDQAVTDLAAVKADYLKTADKTELQSAINTEKGRVDTLVGEDANKSVRSISAEEVAKIVAGADTSFDTLKEIADWISTHGTDATAMNSAIVKLQGIVAGIGGEGEKATVVAYVNDAISALQIGDYAKAADLTALAGRVQTLEGATHTHANKAELDLIASGDKAKWDAVAADYVKASEMVAYTDEEIDSLWNSAMAV